ncbi:MAG: Asp-tRNA(Asn)/Glu-tRNA(Gln) amidotransferase subunit GatA [Puniceicoccales bacterium]|jgi:aspartyl-tRNA(Asn)/glutamyl-tRNA(Gln) amidotransferase subunit A|nr:Asp-tRNA(Asn)/Glu-tRNA(Gln) amidotransferase subunit GatA [Puniceicoccales bacterium]
MADDLHHKTAWELSAALESRSLSAVELMKSLIARTEALDSSLHPFIAYDGDYAIRQAEESDRRRKESKSLGPLDGIPVAIKDNMSVRGWPLTCGSRMLEGYVSPWDCHVVSRLREAGAVLFGRTNMDEFAMGSSTENSAFFTTANPWDRSRVPGGSSGGSACAVASGMVPLAIGTDTGGSIRQPAALCGIAGLKPSYGRVSRSGITAFASSLDQAGPMARCVRDVAILLRAIAGRDRHDSTSSPLPVANYADALGRKRNWTIAVPEEIFSAGIDGAVEGAVRKAIEFYGANGCTIKSVRLPDSAVAIGAYYVTATAEAFSNLSRFDGIRYGHRSKSAKDTLEIYAKSRGEGFGEEVKRRIMLGAFVLSGGYYDAYYGRAQKARNFIGRAFDAIFESSDLVLTPTSPTTAFPIGEKSNDPLAMYLSDIYTVSINLARLPAISIGCGFSQQNLPIGLQLIGKPFGEEDLLAAAHFFESHHDFHSKHPAL